MASLLVVSLLLLDLSAEEAVASGFVQRLPTDGAPAAQRTEVRFHYDDENLHVPLTCC